MDEIENFSKAHWKNFDGSESNFHSHEHAAMRLVLIRYCNSARKTNQEKKKGVATLTITRKSSLSTQLFQLCKNNPVNPSSPVIVERSGTVSARKR